MMDGVYLRWDYVGVGCMAAASCGRACSGVGCMAAASCGRACSGIVNLAHGVFF